MITLAWKRRIDSAPNAEAVVGIAKEFTGTFSQAELERLPPHCRPGALDSPADVTDFAKRISHHFIDGDAAIARLVTRLVEFFAAAAVRLSELPAKTLESDEA